MPGSSHPLEFIFHPRSVAIVGASQSAFGGFVGPIKEMGFQGPIYPVNPRYEQVHDLKCYPSLRDVPDDVDYVISSVPASLVEQLVEDCALKGIKVIHFFTAGFSETGEAERDGLEQKEIARTRELGIRVVGPNCMGLYVPDAGLSFMPGFPKEKGDVAMISQSGANANGFINAGAMRGLRFSKVISYGNGADLCEADFFDYIGDDPETAAIASYMEGARDGRRFFQALKKAAARKPVAILKGGRTEAGSRAMRSHTASLAGSLKIFEGLCRQAGAIRVESMDELVDMMVAFKFIGRVSGSAAAIVGGGGGFSVLSADDVNAEMLEVPLLPEETQRQLSEFTPLAGTSVRNPVDTSVGWGSLDTEPMINTLRIVASAPNIDFVLFATGGAPPRNWARPGQEAVDPSAFAQRHAEAIARIQKEASKPIVLVMNLPGSADAYGSMLQFQSRAAEQGLAAFPGMRRAALALSRLVQWQELRESSG